MNIETKARKLFEYAKKYPGFIWVIKFTKETDPLCSFIGTIGVKSKLYPQIYKKKKRKGQFWTIEKGETISDLKRLIDRLYVDMKSKKVELDTRRSANIKPGVMCQID